jgi:putative heme-binding domain-containing protein
MHEIGLVLGPPLDSYRVRPNEAIALAIAEPSRDLDPKYEQHQIRTTSGEVVVGLLESSGSDSIRIRTAQNALINLERQDIEAWTTAGKSMMPEGLLQEIDPIALSDLIAFLRQPD